jgi:hypothetical protein
MEVEIKTNYRMKELLTTKKKKRKYNNLKSTNKKCSSRTLAFVAVHLGKS